MPPKTPQHVVVTEKFKGGIYYDIEAAEIVVVMRFPYWEFCNDSDVLQLAAERHLPPLYLALAKELAYIPASAHQASQEPPPDQF